MKRSYGASRTRMVLQDPWKGERRGETRAEGAGPVVSGLNPLPRATEEDWAGNRPGYPTPNLALGIEARDSAAVFPAWEAVSLRRASY